MGVDGCEGVGWCVSVCVCVVVVVLGGLGWGRGSGDCLLKRAF